MTKKFTRAEKRAMVREFKALEKKGYRPHGTCSLNRKEAIVQAGWLRTNNQNARIVPCQNGMFVVMQRPRRKHIWSMSAKGLATHFVYNQRDLKTSKRYYEDKYPWKKITVKKIK